MSTPALIAKRLQDIPVRSPRGNEMIRRDPRELPRRLRGLLLAINGQQTVGAYVHTLAGFGDVLALMNELLQLGLIELRSRGHFEIRPEAPLAPKAEPPAHSRGFPAPPSGRLPHAPQQGMAAQGRDRGVDLTRLSADDSSFNSSFLDLDLGLPHDDSPQLESAFNSPADLMGTLYDSTVRGSFDELVMETRRVNPDFSPAPSPPPLTAETKTRQIESLFNLLDQVRRERQALRRRVDQLRKYRDRAKLLAQENKRLSQSTLALVFTCAMLTLMLTLMVFKR